MKTSETTPSTSKNVKNGADTKAADLPAIEHKPDTTVKADGPETGAESEGETKKSGGAVPLMPSAVVYKLDNKVYAAVHHPVDGTSYIQGGKGVGAAKGALEDAGFPLGTLLDKGPNWITAKVPTGATVLGYAHLKGFPLPPQD